MYGRATIIGWLGDAPRNVGKTADVAVFSVGFKTTKKGEDGEYKGAWIDCIAFGDYATSLLECKKGDLIFVRAICKKIAGLHKRAKSALNGK